MSRKQPVARGLRRRHLLACAGALAATAGLGAASAQPASVPAEAPAAFIARQFSQVDIVLLAEDHGVRQNLAFLKALIPTLHAAGVHSIAMEFGGVEEQQELDRLVTGPTHDRALARAMMHRYDSGWPLRDYWDLYHAAWAFNRTLGPGAKPFRIINLSYRLAWETLEGPLTIPAMRRVFHRGPLDAFRARVLEEGVLARGEKTLGFVGWPHAVTRFEPPMLDIHAAGFVRRENRNLGNLLHASHPGKVRCVVLHAPFPAADGRGLVQAAGGALERMFVAYGAPCAFDLRGPAGRWPDGSSHAAGDPEFVMGEFADGYIVLDRLSRLEGCELDTEFVTDRTFADARRRFPRELRRQPATLEAYWASARAFVDIGARYREVG
jgi:hypothetical protein